MGKFKQEQIKERNRKINEVLNTLFSSEKGYEELHLKNGYWLVRMGGDKLVIAIYTEDNFKKYKEYGLNKK